LDKCVNEIYKTGLINQPVVQPPVVQQTGVQHGGVWNPFKSNKHTVETNTLIIEYLVQEPTNLISNDNLAAYFQKVYKFVQSISKPTEKDNAKTVQQITILTPKELSSPTAPGVEVGSTANINQPPAVGVAAAASALAPAAPAVQATAPATTTAAVQAPAQPAEKKGFFGLFVRGGRATRKKARRTKSAQHPKSKSYKYRVKL
jgi:hypothetical protein